FATACCKPRSTSPPISWGPPTIADSHRFVTTPRRAATRLLPRSARACRALSSPRTFSESPEVQVEKEDDLLRRVAIENAKSILQARQRFEEELLRAKEALERKTEELARSLAMLRATLESTTDGI